MLREQYPKRFSFHLSASLGFETLPMSIVKRQFSTCIAREKDSKLRSERIFRVLKIKKIEKSMNVSRKQYQKWSTMNLIKSCER